ncbi:MAG: histidine kinase [Actinocatenispora sp.]
MRVLVSWVRSACVGFVRACAVLAVGALVPAVWAAAVALGVWWVDGPWTLLPVVLWGCVGTFLLSRPVCRMFRHLVGRWTGADLPGGYRRPGTMVQMSTGYWWNGHSYERSRRRAREDLELRLRFTDPATWRDLRFMAVAPFAALVAAVPSAGVAAAVVGVLQPAPVWRLVGVLGVVVAVAAAAYAWRPTVPLTVRFLSATPAMLLADRVDELMTQRADTTVAQAAEIRRIGRDLHDGAQARLVSLGLSLVTAEKLMETDPDQARALMREARVGASASLKELRDLVRGISPPVLNERGLVDAVRALALNCPLPATVTAEGRFDLDPPIEAAVYFGIAELLTNAVKHAHADTARISLTHDDTALVAEVDDDGEGGADVRTGGGLAGLRRRLAAFDGTLDISSPTGGPTRTRMVVPCASS